MGRDPSRLYPDTDTPKLDFLMTLADVLEWPLDAVAEYLWLGVEPGAEPDPRVTDFETGYELSVSAYRQGEYTKALEIARRLHALAAEPRQRALALNCEFLAWDGLGRYTKAAAAIESAVKQSPLPVQMRLTFQSNLANAHCTLWQLHSARGIARSILDWFHERPVQSFKERVAEAFAGYVAGQAALRLMTVEVESVQYHARDAAARLAVSQKQYLRLADEAGRPDFRGIARTCEGGLLEAAVELGDKSPEAAVDQIIDELGAVSDLAACPAGDWLESHGWWAVFGSNIALRHLTGRKLQLNMAILLNKLVEIADRMDNWAFRERAITMEHALRERVADATGFELPASLDTENVRVIAGAMGRFPHFRELGWGLLRVARNVRHDGEN